MSRHVAIRRLLIACVTATLVLGSLGVQLVAAASVTFGTASASSTFGKSLTFRQSIADRGVGGHEDRDPAALPGGARPDPHRGTAGDAARCRQPAAHVHVGSGQGRPHRAEHRHRRDLAGHHGRWRGRPTARRSAIATVTTGSTGRRETGDLVSIHWYEGDARSATRALAIAEQGVANAEKLLGVTEKDPIDFYVYADQNAFYAALGPGTPRERRRRGARRHPDDVRADHAGPGEPVVGQDVVPHELTHLVFNTAVDNPYHFPPSGSTRGSRSTCREGYASSDRDAVERAGADRDLAPLAGLSGGFPNGDRFFLAYAESVSAVDYMVRTYGKPALVKLIRSYAKGADRRRGVQGRAGRRHRRLRRRAGGRTLGAKADGEHGPAAGAGRSAPRRLGRRRPRRRAAAARDERGRGASSPRRPSPRRPAAADRRRPGSCRPGHRRWCAVSARRRGRGRRGRARNRGAGPAGRMSRTAARRCAGTASRAGRSPSGWRSSPSAS